MTKSGKLILEGSREAVAIAKGEQPAARIHISGHSYVPEAEYAALAAERDRLAGLVDRLRQEAQIHAGEARAANSTINEIYQAITGATGEPGNWHGAEPVKALLAERDRQSATIEALKAELQREHALNRPLVSELERLKVERDGFIEYRQKLHAARKAAESTSARLAERVRELEAAIAELDWRSPQISPGTAGATAIRVLVLLERKDNPPALNAPPRYAFGHRIVRDDPPKEWPEDGWFFDGQDDSYRVTAWRHIDPHAVRYFCTARSLKEGARADGH